MNLLIQDSEFLQVPLLVRSESDTSLHEVEEISESEV